MGWVHTEYILKGLYLGLLLFAALRTQSWQATFSVALVSFSGLIIALGVAAASKFGEGYRVGGRPMAFFLFLLLECPAHVYAGILLGTAAGIFLFLSAQDPAELLICVAGGVGLGILLSGLRVVRDRRLRWALSLSLAGLLVLAGLYWFGVFEEFKPAEPRTVGRLFALQLLLGLPWFYLLTFAGREEETEVEIAALCAAFGLGLRVLTQTSSALHTLGFLVPLLVYLGYTLFILPRLRVFKHTIRGFSYARIGRQRQALLSFRRATQLDPENKLAREGLWSIHKNLDHAKLAKDPETLAVIDFELCMERVASLLLQPNPGPEKLEEAHRLLDLVMSQRPEMQLRVAYWRAVAFTHARQFDRAAAELEPILDCMRPSDPAARQAILPAAWQLALMLHEELRQRVGLPQLALPGRRMDAIAAVEKHLAASPDDQGIFDLKRMLYQDVTEAEYQAAVGAAHAAAHFDHNYVEQLGSVLIEDASRWQRGAEYLRLAARGLPQQGPSLYSKMARACERAGDPEQAWNYYELAVRAGQSVGLEQLSDAEKQVYFVTVKKLAESAQAHDDIDRAIEFYRLYTESDRCGLETYRQLARLYERKGLPIAALWATEQALLFNSKDKDLLERKDRYYYSVMPDALQKHLDAVRGTFDTGYCFRKARFLLDARSDDPELIDWAEHLLRLALVVEPGSLSAKVLLARACLRRGAKDEAIALLEEVRSLKPERFSSSEDEDAWYLSCRLLGDIYLYELGKPELAVECLTTFRKSHKSGADTLYKLGHAYEQLGDFPRARKCYEHVTAYSGHPLVPDAQEALDRLQAG